MTKSEILAKVSEEEIFKKYIPGFEPGKKKNYKSPFSNKDDNPSFSVYYSTSGKLMYKSHNTGHMGDAFQLVSDLKGIDNKKNFNQVIEELKKDFGLNELSAKVANKINVDKTDNKKNIQIEFEDTLKPDLLAYFNNYKIDINTLIHFNLKQVKYHEFISVDNKHCKFDYKKNKQIAVCYTVNNHIKIYFPDIQGVQQKSFGFKDQTTKDVFGLDQLQPCERLFIAAGEKDCLALNANGFTSISFQSENYIPNKEQIDLLTSKANRIFVVYDNDEAGIKASDKICIATAWKKFILPGEYKDVSDFFYQKTKEDFKKIPSYGAACKIATTNKITIQKNEGLEKIEGLFRILNNNEGKFKDLIINQSKLLELIASFGFRRFDISNEYVFVRITNNILEQVSQVIIQDTVIDFLISLPDVLQHDVYKSALLEKIRKGRETFFSKGFFSFLKNEKEYKFCTDTKEDAFVFYKNGFVKCNKSGIEFLSYDNLVGYVWKKQILNRDFHLIDEDKKQNKIFETFISNTCSNNKERVKSISSMIGYLLHNFFETKLKAIVFTDSTISDEPNGRTGKTLLGKGLQQIKPVAEINGKNFEPHERFKYQDVDFETQVVMLNDLKRNFPVEMLFNDITEKIKIERKNQSPFHLQAKFVITTNRTLKIENASAKDRFIEFEFSDYYNEKNSPLAEFGKWFFSSEFDLQDWIEFDNFMCQCISYYLKFGIIEASSINLNRRKLIEQTNNDFVEWFDEMIEEEKIKHLVEYDKTQLHSIFLSVYPDYKENKFLKLQKNFTNYLITYTKYSEHLETYNALTDSRKSNEQRLISFRFKEKDTPVK